MMWRDLLKAILLAAPVIALAGGPAHAEPILQLNCKTGAGSPYNYLVDIGTGKVQEYGEGGVGYTNRIAKATITDAAIVWSLDQPGTYKGVVGKDAGKDVKATEHWEGHIDRVANTGWEEEHFGGFPLAKSDFTCTSLIQTPAANPAPN